jgi:hypothetical protein
MRIAGDTISFRSTPEWFDIEKGKTKPNTVRLLDWDELERIANTDIKHVTIECTTIGDERRWFTRDVTGLWNLGGVLGKTLFMVCWKP